MSSPDNHSSSPSRADAPRPIGSQEDPRGTDTASAGHLIGRLITTIHHHAHVESFLENGDPPPGYHHTIDKFASIHRPSSPTRECWAELQRATEACYLRCYRVLDSHYAKALETHIIALEGLGDSPNWTDAWALGVRRASAELGTTASAVTLHLAKAYLPCDEDPTGATPPAQLTPPVGPLTGPLMRSNSRPPIGDGGISDPNPATALGLDPPDLGSEGATGPPPSPFSSLRSLVASIHWSDLDSEGDDLPAAGHNTPPVTPRAAATLTVPLSTTPPTAGATSGPSSQAARRRAPRTATTPVREGTTPPGPLPLSKRHDHRGRKGAWSVTPTRATLIMGDSNLLRLPPFLLDHVQVDCYPGAKFYHANNILAKMTAPALHVKRVVLSFGLNNRADQTDTSTRQALDMFNKACVAFPHGSIRVPLINASAGLPRPERDTISSLNEFLKSTIPTVPLLPADRFVTEEDHVHWTAATASNIHKHWINYLNLVSSADQSWEERKELVNLSSHFRPSLDQTTLLVKGLSFVPTLNLAKGGGRQVALDVSDYHRRLKLAAFFEGRERDDPAERPRFFPRSSWTPRDSQLPQGVADLVREETFLFLLL